MNPLKAPRSIYLKGLPLIFLLHTPLQHLCFQAASVAAYDWTRISNALINEPIRRGCPPPEGTFPEHLGDCGALMPWLSTAIGWRVMGLNDLC